MSRVNTSTNYNSASVLSMMSPSKRKREAQSSQDSRLGATPQGKGANLPLGNMKFSELSKSRDECVPSTPERSSFGLGQSGYAVWGGAGDGTELLKSINWHLEELQVFHNIFMQNASYFSR
jgi:hypothetical protein